MSRPLTISDQLLARLEAAARRRGLDSVEQLLEVWQASEEQREQQATGEQAPTEESRHSTQRQDLEQRFQQLAAQWRRDVWPLSSVSKIVQHPAYQQIIALGKDVVPLILRELERQPEYWFAALRALTGVDPVAPEDRGRMDRMAAAWVRWGREHGLGG